VEYSPFAHKMQKESARKVKLSCGVFYFLFEEKTGEYSNGK